MKESVLVTGATGFIGSYLVKQLVELHVPVFVLTRQKKNATLRLDGVTPISGDLFSSFPFPSGVRTIYHCAGVINDPDKMMLVNVEGTHKIVELAMKHNCRLIHLSSAGVIGDTSKTRIDEKTNCSPAGLYENSKYEAELTVLDAFQNGLEGQVLRPTIVFGIGRNPEQDSFLHLIRAIKRGTYANIGNGVYNIIAVEEVARALIALNYKTIPNGEVFFLNTPISFQEFADIVYEETTGAKGKIKRIPYSVAYFAALIGDIIQKTTGKKMALTSSRIKALSEKRVFDASKITSITEYKPLMPVDMYVRKCCHGFSSIGFL